MDLVVLGLSALIVRDCAVENCLHVQVGPAIMRLNVNPSRGVSVDQVLARLAANRLMIKS